MTVTARFFPLALVLVAPVAVSQTTPEDCPMHKDHQSAAEATPAPAQAPAAAPAEGHAHHDHAASPYAGKAGSEVKALTAEEIQALRDGAGMGLAKPAELNHYPGPRHVLDLARELSLTPAQADQLKAVFDRMHEEAVSLGRQIIDKEITLDREFASGGINEARLRDLTARIGSLQAGLRAAHLKA